MIGGFVQAEAHWLLKGDAVDRYQPGSMIHPGDALGEVIAWLWTKAPEAVPLVFADYLAQLHKWDDLANDRSARIRMDDLLAGLAFAMPNNFPTSEFDRLRERIERDTPEAYGANPNP